MSRETEAVSTNPTPPPARVLVIEDETTLAGLIAAYLSRAGYVTTTVHTGPDGVQAVREHAPDVVILDLGLPGLDGIEVCRQIRTFSDCYVIVVTARKDEVDTLIGLSVGADDYVTKPFSVRELLARVQTVLRRRRASSPADAPGLLEFEGLRIDAARRCVQCLGRDVELTGTEFELLHLLARESGRVLSRDDILNQLRGHEAELYTRAVDIVVSRLRKKLEPLDCIKTLRNAGYSLALRRVAG